jgi:hypothetical protein
VQVTDQVRVSSVDEACGLAAEDCLGVSAVEEDIFHVELLNGSVTGDSSGEHRVNSGRFYNRAEGLIVVDSGALSKTPKDPTGLVAIKGPVSTKLIREDPLAGDNVGALRSGNQLPGPIADQGSILFLHSRTPMGLEDGVGEEVATVRTRRSGTTLKPVLPRVIIRCGLSGGVTGTTTP